jgi:hypothetical protein
MINVYTFLVGKTEKKISLWRPGHRLQYNFKMDLQNAGFHGAKLTRVAYRT